MYVINVWAWPTNFQLIKQSRQFSSEHYSYAACALVLARQLGKPLQQEAQQEEEGGEEGKQVQDNNKHSIWYENTQSFECN